MMKRLVTLIAVLVVASFIATEATGTTHQDGSRNRVFAPKDCTKPEVKPSRLVIACADFGAFVRVKRWTRWNDDRAKGRGLLHANECVPAASCGPSEFRKYKVKVRLGKIQKTRCGGRRVPLFTKLRLKFPSEKPAYAHRIRQTRLFCNP